MDFLRDLRRLSGLKEASTADVVTPGADFLPPGFHAPMPRLGDDPAKRVSVPIGWDKTGGGGGGGGSQGAPSSSASSSSTTPPAAPPPSTSSSAPGDVEVVNVEPGSDFDKYLKDLDAKIAAKEKGSQEQLPYGIPKAPNAPDVNLPPHTYPDKIPKPPKPSKDVGIDAITIPELPTGTKSQTTDPTVKFTGPQTDKAARPAPLDFSAPEKKDDADSNVITVTPKKPTPQPSTEPPRPSLSNMFGGGLQQPKPEEPKPTPPKIAAPSIAPAPTTGQTFGAAPTPPKVELPKTEPKIAPPVIIPPMVTTAPPAPQPPKIAAPSIAPAPVTGPTFGGQPEPTFGGGGRDTAGQGQGRGPGDRPGSGQGTGQGPGQGSGTGGGMGSGTGRGSGPGAGPGEGPGGQWNNHHWFQYVTIDPRTGRETPAMPQNLPPGWKHIGNGQFVSELPRDAYTEKTRPKMPYADSQKYMATPDWSKQYKPVREDDSLAEIRKLAGMEEENSLIGAFGGGITPAAPKAQDDEPAAKPAAQQQPAGHIQQAPTQPQAQQRPPQTPQPQSAQPPEQVDATGPEYIKRYKTGAGSQYQDFQPPSYGTPMGYGGSRPPPLIFQQPSYGGPIVGPGYRGPVYRGPNPYARFGQGRR